MEMPIFRTDQEMAEWFEEHDVSAADLELADITISTDLTVSLVAEVNILSSRLRNAPSVDQPGVTTPLTPVVS